MYINSAVVFLFIGYETGFTYKRLPFEYENRVWKPCPLATDGKRRAYMFIHVCLFTFFIPVFIPKPLESFVGTFRGGMKTGCGNRV